MKTFIEAQTEAVEQGRDLTRKIHGLVERYKINITKDYMVLTCSETGDEFWPEKEEQKEKVWGVV